MTHLRGSGFIGEFHGDGKGFGHGLAVGRDRVDIHNSLEEVIQLQRGKDASGMGNVRVGKDQVTGWQGSDHIPHDRVRASGNP